MAQSSRIVLLLGSGPNLGAHISRKFISAGYQVAAVSRSGKHPEPDTISLTVKANLAEPKNVNRIFEEVRAKLGEPSVVVYNGTDRFLARRMYPRPLCINEDTFFS